VQEIAADNAATKEYQDLIKALKVIENGPVKDVELLEPDVVVKLAMYEFDEKRIPVPKYPTQCCHFLVFDDVLGTDLLKQ
jgi:hypothetical protein